MTAFNRANVDKLAEGTLTTYDSQVDITTGTIKMRATFDNSKGALFPQQFVNVRLLIDTLKGVALAPNAAVQIGPTGDFVYLLNADGTVSKRDVVAGPSDGKSTTITSGLAAGDKVVIDGVDRLRDGAKVTVVGAPGERRRAGRRRSGRLRREAFARGEGDLRRSQPRIRVGGGSARVRQGQGSGSRQGRERSRRTARAASASAARDCLAQLPSGGTPAARRRDRPASGGPPAAPGAAK